MSAKSFIPASPKMLAGPTKMAGYFDYAAATPLEPRVLKAMQPYLTDNFYNPSADYLAAKAVRATIEHARADVAKVIGAKPSEIVFTAGATEANNLAIHGVLMAHAEAGLGETNLVVSAIEHEAVLAPAKKHTHRTLPVKPDGLIDLSKLESLIDGRTVLVSIMLVNNELGTIQPLKEVVKVLAKIRKKRSRQDNSLPLYLHTDASQAGLMDLQYTRLGVDLMTINGAKMYGPKQSAALFVRTPIRLKPLIDGGGQERNLRSGTENAAAVVGLANAFSLVSGGRQAETKRLTGLKLQLARELGQNFKNMTISGDQKHCSPAILHLTLPGQDNERLVYALDEKGYMVAAGSACSAGNDENHVLTAIGLSTKMAQSSLRISLGKYSTTQSISGLVAALKEVILLTS